MPPTPLPPRYDPPAEDPRWRDWMRSALFSPEDKANLLRPRSNATKLPYPFRPAPQGNVALGAKAKAALSAHIEAFEERLSEDDSPGIREMLIDDARVVYDAELKACGEESEDAFLLYLLRPVRFKKDDKFVKFSDDTEWFDPVVDFYDDASYEILCHEPLSAAAFKTFAAHVSTYPGCAAKQTADVKRKFKGAKVAVSREGSAASRASTRWKLTPDQAAAKTFYDTRVDDVGVPPAGEHDGVGMPAPISRRRPTALERVLGPETTEKTPERNLGFQYDYDETPPGSDDMFAPPPKDIDWQDRGYFM